MNGSTAFSLKAPLDGWRKQPQAAEISAEEFGRHWADARRVLGDPA
ncbi:hypothetical protein [Streptomyces chrestomyceticus]